MNQLRGGGDFVFSEGAVTSALEGEAVQHCSVASSLTLSLVVWCSHDIFVPTYYLNLVGTKNHFEKDKADIKNRAQSALEDAKKRHAAEFATLEFSRIMIFHKTMPCPSQEEESLIDNKMQDLVELSDFGSAQHVLTAANQLASSVNGKSKSNEKIFDLALQAIRLVHVRRTISKVSDTGKTNSYADNYKLLLEKCPEHTSYDPSSCLIS